MDGNVILAAPTVLGQFFPDAMYATNLGLASKGAFRANLSCHSGHFAAKHFQLIHHSIDGSLECCNLRVHLRGLDLNPHRKISVSDLCDDPSDFSQRFLEGLICLLVFSELSFEHPNILGLDLVEGQFGPLVRIVETLADLGNHVFL